MIRYLKKAIPLSILATGIIASASIADTFTLRVGSGHPSKPTAYVCLLYTSPSPRDS